MSPPGAEAAPLCKFQIHDQNNRRTPSSSREWDPCAARVDRKHQPPANTSSEAHLRPPCEKKAQEWTQVQHGTRTELVTHAARDADRACGFRAGLETQARLRPRAPWGLQSTWVLRRKSEV